MLRFNSNLQKISIFLMAGVVLFFIVFAFNLLPNNGQSKKDSTKRIELLTARIQSLQEELNECKLEKQNKNELDHNDEVNNEVQNSDENNNYGFNTNDEIDTNNEVDDKPVIKTPKRKPLRGGYTFWSSDFHISVIADIKDLFADMPELNLKVIDKSLSGHCHLKGTCAKDLRVLNQGNGIEMGHCPMALKRQFFDSYKNDPEMQSVDAFICDYPVAMCELFMPFNKSMILLAPTRYETGRYTPSAWNEWNKNVHRIAKDPRNIIIANNPYDAEYMKYFTGLKDIPVFESYCAYTKSSYAPTKKEILIGPSRVTVDANTFFNELQQLVNSQKKDYVFKPIRSLYPRYEYSDLTSHPAIVNIPYQVSIMSFFEYYRMNIPMFFPSPKLLAEWHVTYGILNERTWETVRGNKRRESLIKKAENVQVSYDPNNEFDKEHIEYWLQFSDFYNWKHVILFDSWQDLINKLDTTDFSEVSNRMKEENKKTKQRLVRQWTDAFHRMFDDLPEGGRKVPDNFDKAMSDLYGLDTKNIQC